MGGYDGISSMNHFESMEIDDNVDFLFLHFFVTFTFPIGATLCHLHFFLYYMHWVVQMRVCKSSSFFMCVIGIVGCSQHPNI
jgi:hypothetical protein